MAMTTIDEIAHALEAAWTHALPGREAVQRDAKLTAPTRVALLVLK
jgi:hypothetical protein